MLIVFEHGVLKLNVEEFIFIYKNNYSIMELVLFIGWIQSSKLKMKNREASRSYSLFARKDKYSDPLQ